MLLNALLQVLRLIKVLQQPSVSVKRSLCSLGLSLLQQQDLCETTVKQITEQVLVDSHMLVFSVLLEYNHCVLHLQLPAISSKNLNYYYSSGNSCQTPFQTDIPCLETHPLNWVTALFLQNTTKLCLEDEMLYQYKQHVSTK